jgi:hypothetical protein
LLESRDPSLGSKLVNLLQLDADARSGSASPLFARSDLRNVLVKPMFVYQPPPWQAEGALPPWEGPVPPCPFADAQRASRA